MSAIKDQEPVAFSDEPESAATPWGYALNVVGVYQDTVTHNWTVPMSRLVSQLAKEELVETKWYDVDSLSDAATFQEAVGAARLADVIVISVYAAEELPANLYVWIDAWLPRRRARAGASVVGDPADLGVGEDRAVELGRLLALRVEPEARGDPRHVWIRSLVVCG